MTAGRGIQKPGFIRRKAKFQEEVRARHAHMPDFGVNGHSPRPY